MSSSEEENLEKLSVYFSKTEWTRLQKCEKVRFKNIKRNHLAMLAIGLTSTTPAFMKRGRARRAMLLRTCPAEDSDSDDEEWRLAWRRPLRVKNAGVGGVEEGKAFLDSATEKQRGGSKPANRGLLKKELNTYTRGDNLRSRPSVRYTEEEEPRDEDYLYSPAPLGASSRAQLTLPLGLEVRVSGIPGAGLGVFNRDQRLPVGVHFGPYEGELTRKR
ncbi:hypothetical protein AAFF_G00298000 [Aldrovandia affinis]|uniref:KRAB-related domain-containing protein n=1 Tax=Aldrovandia affinis TaxID=143900 RepID=A0AAD7R8U8_9TELE|nr:hypothetical protein AAFF_G00298000 [Aldrovandia affinis]